MVAKIKFYMISVQMLAYIQFIIQKNLAQKHTLSNPHLKFRDFLQKKILGLIISHKLVNVIPNAATKNKISNFFQLNYFAGNAGATFGDKLVEKNLKSMVIKKFLPIKYKTLGISLDHLINHKIIKKPDLIKIDVDGNEYEVILGLEKFLQKKIKISILIEIDSRLKSSKLVHSLLKKLNFKLSHNKNDNFIYSK